MYIFLLNISVMPKPAFQKKKKKSMLYVLVTEILKWLKVTVMQMEWKNWSSQQNMAKQEINVQKHTFLYRGLNSDYNS